VEWYEMTGLTFILIALVIGVVVIVMRWFNHRERLAMIERGLVPPGAPAPGVPGGIRSARRTGKGLLIGGIGLAVLGLALLCAALFLALPMLTGLSSSVGPSSLGVTHLPGLLVLFMGIALLIVYLIAQPTTDRPRADLAPQVDVPPQASDEPELEPFADASSDELEVKVAGDT
jgi:hypothetical protein